MQRGQVDLVITGADRVTRRGDVANKIGTYLKALAARDTGIPFYVALPTSTLDWTLGDGLVEIPIEERSEREVTHLSGVGPSAAQEIEVAVASPGSAAANPAFDVTPARLITALITERGIAPPSEQALAAWRPT
jgi:methylthioribose-1-phosphate isomerase